MLLDIIRYYYKSSNIYNDTKLATMDARWHTGFVVPQAHICHICRFQLPCAATAAVPTLSGSCAGPVCPGTPLGCCGCFSVIGSAHGGLSFHVMLLVAPHTSYQFSFIRPPFINWIIKVLNWNNVRNWLSLTHPLPLKAMGRWRFGHQLDLF